MIQSRSTAVAVTVLSLLAACSQEAAEPPAVAPVQPVAPAITAPAVGYACESGKAVSVQYPDAGTAQLTYQNQVYALRTVQAASGARYSGSGVEWWTATRNGQETATLSRLGPNADVGVAILERCSRPSPGAPTEPPLPTPGAVLPASTPCKSAQLKLSGEGGDAGMGNRVAILGVQNIGLQACSLTGYPAVTVLDGRGRTLTTIRSEPSPDNYFRGGEAPTPVNLAPRAKAYFDLAWNVVPNEAQGEKTCPGAATVRVMAPGDTTAVTLAQAFTPCGGRIRVGPVRPVADDSAPVAAPTPIAGP